MDILDTIFFVMKLRDLKYFTHFGVRGRRVVLLVAKYAVGYILGAIYIILLKLGDVKTLGATFSEIG